MFLFVLFLTTKGSYQVPSAFLKPSEMVAFFIGKKPLASQSTQ